MLEAHLQELSHPLNDHRVREQRFLEAWRRGVKIAGVRFFEVTAPSVDTATHKNELRPNWDLIEEQIDVLSHGQAAFLASMCSFYNSEWGQRLLERIGFPNICDVASKLDRERSEVIVELFLTYPGW